MHMKALQLPQKACFRSRQGARRNCTHVLRAGRGFGEKSVTKKPEGQKERDRIRTSKEETLNSEASTPLPQQRIPDAPQEVPEVINQRLLSRMLTFSLVPVLLGFLSLPLLAYIQVGLKVDLPTGTAFAVSGLFFGAGLLGISYGILSASWVENQEGSGLGLEEFKANTAPLVDRIKRGSKK